MAEQVDAERERVFKAISIIACCRLACASKFVYHPQVMTDALQAAHDILDEAAGELEMIGSQHSKEVKS